MLSRPFDCDILEMASETIGVPLGYMWRDMFVGSWISDTTEGILGSMLVWAC